MARREERRGAISSSDSQGKKMVFLRKKSFEIYVKYLATFPSAPIPPSKKPVRRFKKSKCLLFPEKTAFWEKKSFKSW